MQFGFMPPTQSLMIDHHFCPDRVSLSSQERWPQLCRRQFIAFVLITLHVGETCTLLPIMLFLGPHGPKTFSTSWISFKISRQIPQTNPRTSQPLPHVDTQASELDTSHLIFAKQMLYTAYGAIGEISTSEKKTGRDWPQVMADHKAVGLLLISTDFHYLWGNMFPLIGWFHGIGGQCTNSKLIYR